MKRIPAISFILAIELLMLKDFGEAQPSYIIGWSHILTIPFLFGIPTFFGYLWGKLK